ALLVYTDEDKKIHELDLTVLLQNSSVFNEFLKNFVNSVSVDETITTIVAEQKDGKNTGNYDYFNEERALAG
ncbi:type I secretion C-terminal target domain-containing protein, partial [Myroides odoratimimus]|uniref:type I secretion C-terminal target domain-containing protein n=3 Tax=Myroides TaxID=76831 RepID=UPI002DBF78B0